MDHKILKLCVITIYGLLLATPVVGYCPCTKEYIPVCGWDYETYANECLMMCAGVRLRHEGKCHAILRGRSVCPCPKIYDPVCGDDGITYNNMCLLECAGAEYIIHGRCGTAWV